MSEAMTATARDANGRFLAGQSGNPAGKKPGTRNRATLLCDALADGEDGRVARILIDKALAGDAVAARFLVDRLMPRPRDRAIELDLPEGNTAVDALAASNATVAAMAAGEITPDEALRVTRVLEGRLRALRAAVKEREDRREEAHPAKNLHRQDSPHPTIAIAMGTPEHFSQGLSRAFDKSSGGRGVLPADLLHSTCISTLAARAAGGLRWAGPPRPVPSAAAFS